MAAHSSAANDFSQQPLVNNWPIGKQPGQVAAAYGLWETFNIGQAQAITLSFSQNDSVLCD